jgi:histidinol phosphatase-like PHP family hydrolase
MTFTDDSGKRMRLWIKEEVGEIPDPQKFMEMYVDRIVGVLTKEPIDIHVNPTFLPEIIAADYDRLWTPERMQKVIAAASQNDVAIEINSRYRIPSAAFIKAARQAGVKFSFGTNNEGRELGRLEYCLKMVKECGLTWEDFFVPRPDGQKPIQKRGLV